MSASEEAFVPDMDRRTTLNLILAGSIGINVLGLAVPYLAFFVPPGAGGGGGGVIAKDAIGSEVTTESWLATHTAGSRELAEGIKVGLGWSCGHWWRKILHENPYPRHKARVILTMHLYVCIYSTSELL